MGFFDKLSNAVTESYSEMKKYEEKYRNLSKEELKEKYQSAWSNAERAAIRNIAKEKGYN